MLIIFDFDDTLVSSAATWKASEQALFTLLGGTYSAELAQRYKGQNARDIGRTVHAMLQPAGYDAEACGRLLREMLLERFRASLTPMPGAETLVHRLAERYPLAIASGSPAEAIHLTLARFGWSALFPLVVSTEEVACGKPAPDVFLEAARRANCPPAQALVIEDSLHGVHAARAAGMACFAVPSSDDPRIVLEADRTFTRLDAITLEAIAGLRSLASPPSRPAATNQ
jgi:HAD superfamily hydrolase (TIGR01509 family)